MPRPLVVKIPVHRFLAEKTPAHRPAGEGTHAPPPETDCASCMPTEIIDYTGWLSTLNEPQFDRVAEAAETLLTIQQALSNEHLSLLGELLRDQGDEPTRAWVHYPQDDCRDVFTGAMYYYHTHDPEDWVRDEHGHFHLFFRPQAEGEFTHIMALSMNTQGFPIGVFATNGWVTDEKMQPAHQILQRIDEHWEINRVRPSWLVAQWLNAMMTLLRPHAETLLQQRDGKIASAGAMQDETNPILANREIHVLSELPLDLPPLLQSVQNEAKRRFLS